MNIFIEKPISGGTVKAVASKSQAHRLLICAALSEKETYIECAERSDDIDATVGCLKSLGTDIRHDGEGFTVNPARPRIASGQVTQVCGASGATLRFMLPVCCALGVTADFVLVGQHRDRPISPLLEQLAANGCDISIQKNSIRCTGKLGSGEFFLQGNISSQFISGLLLSLPLLEGYSVINIEGLVESMPYVTMTLEALDAFGITVKRRGSRAGRGAIYMIEGSQSYRSPGRVRVEGDWSSAAAWLGAGAIGGCGVTCTGLNLGSSQGDMAIMRLLARFGANVAYEGGSVSVAPAKLHGIQIDASDTPDLVPVLSAVASVAAGETLISGAGRLRIKESDRLRSVAETLRAIGAKIRETEDGLVIRGVESLRGGTVTSFSDHRIVMMAAVASIACKEPVAINVAEVVSKSYPGFFEDFEALGGQVIEDGSLWKTQG